MHGPLHRSDPRRSAHPNRPDGHGLARPHKQYDPLWQGSTRSRVVLLPVNPTVYSPGSARVGAALPSVQYTLAGSATSNPHSTCMGVAEPPVHRCPGAHGPVQAGVARAVVLPKRPGGHGVRSPCAQKDPMGQASWVQRAVAGSVSGEE